MELELEVPEVPERHGLVGGPGGQDELGVGVEAQAVHLGRVRVHGVGGLQERERDNVSDCIISKIINTS